MENFKAESIVEEIQQISRVAKCYNTDLGNGNNEEFLQKLVSSMLSRIKSVLKSNGGNCKY